MTYITAIGSAVPNYQISQQQATDAISNILHLSQEEKRKLQILYRATQIKTRYSVLPDFTQQENFSFFQKPEVPTAKRMQIYQKEALPLAQKAVQDCFQNQPRKLAQITHLITVSCTGMYAPGLDIDLVKALNLPSSVQRTCINFMGCYASFNALKVAYAFSKTQENAKVLIVGVELCTLHLQPDLSEDNLLSQAIFADGAAAVLVENQASSDFNFQLQDFHCDLTFEGEKEMAWQIGDYGFEMKLSSYVPQLLGQDVGKLLNSLFQKKGLELSDIPYFAFHPGGKKILEVLQKSLCLDRNTLQFSYQVWENYGNMSSVTVLFVLKELLKSLTNDDKGKKILSMAFGPGLTLESAILEIA